MPKNKIALVAASTAPIPDVLGGGAERLVTMLIDQNEIDNKVEFIVFSIKNKKAKLQAKKYKYTKFVYLVPSNLCEKLYNFIILKLSYLFKNNLCKKGYYLKIAKWVEKNKVDIVIDENGYTEDFKKITDIVGIHNTSAHVHWMVNPMKRNINNNYGSIIGVSDFIIDFWMTHTKNRQTIAKIVYSAVDEKRFNQIITDNVKYSLRHKYNIEKQDFVFIYCGRIDEQKGVLELYKAFRQIKNKNVKLLIVGSSNKKDSKMSSYNRQLLEEARTDQNIIFTGYIDNDKLINFYQISNVQVIPTLTEEAAGLVAIEGMLSGLPIIATNSGGLVEYVDTSCALIVEKDNNLVNNLSKAMIKLLENKELCHQMGINAIKRGKQFSQKKYYDDFITAIDEILNSI